ncbi:cytochrome c oxidase polypeptide VIb [Venturia nashicola]|uniref:Cytochrome c oxidase subunit 12, mitochondrial n=1 Tax=Venturia nashicola TaxID=86259 RepID=A0A4Z1PPQ7_9PEZI|nr:cytochrome c oxidase polypeptide VIb [Venturia nashicola]TLD36926.1 cytochrome c oxidase polypeptide VIb [Venturia nashicola]
MSDDGEERVTKPFKFVTANFAHTAGFDARFPNQNQTKHCWQNYVDYHKCITARGEDFPPCRQFFLAFKSLCPSAWTARWDDQRANRDLDMRSKGTRRNAPKDSTTNLKTAQQQRASTDNFLASA